MRSLADALHRADNNQPHGGEPISGARAIVTAGVAAPSSVTAHRSETSRVNLPVVALRPTGDGIGLARTLARVLVRRALTQEGAIGAAVDCASPTPLP